MHDTMDQSKKLERDSDGDLSNLLCIVHVTCLKYSAMESFSACKDPEKKFSKLKEVKALRLGQPPGSSYRMKDSCDLIPDELNDTDGYHWECYKRFTGNLDRLEPLAGTSQDKEGRVDRTKRRRSGECTIFNPD